MSDQEELILEFRFRRVKKEVAECSGCGSDITTEEEVEGSATQPREERFHLGPESKKSFLLTREGRCKIATILSKHMQDHIQMYLSRWAAIEESQS